MSILHVGYPKAASTSIQWNVFSHCTDHVYISRENNGGTQESEEVYNQVSQNILDGAKPDLSRDILFHTTKGNPFIFSDERILLHYGLKKTALFHRVNLCRNIFGDVTVFIVMRKPKDQMLSLYKHIMIDRYRNKGLLPDQGFHDWLGEIQGSRFWEAGDILQGLFFGRMAALYASAFGKNNIKILFFEDFIAGGDNTYSRIAEDLGLKDYAPQEKNITMNATSEKKAFREISENTNSKYSADISEETGLELEKITRSEAKILQRYTNYSAPEAWL